MCNALGIITYNGLNVYVQGLQEYRPIAGFNFLGRYRLVDFPISNMTNSGIDEIQVFIKGNPRPMIEHIGDGRQYNINSKHGSLDLIPYYNEEGRGNPEFAPDVESYYNNINQIEDNIWVHKTVKIAPTASLTGPLIVDADTEIRPSAFVRGKAIVGKNCVVGNSTELKNVVLFNTVQVPHYNYVGDSILGTHSHMGAGSITSNVKSDKTLVVVKNGDEQIETGLKKFGAMLGDYVEVGCNSVLNPGTVIGRHCNVYPLSSVRGVIPEGHIFKDKNNIIKKK